MTAIERKLLNLKSRYEPLEREAQELSDGLQSGKIGKTPETRSRLKQCISEMEQINVEAEALGAEQDAEDVALLTEQLHGQTERMAHGGGPVALRGGVTLTTAARPSQARFSQMFTGPAMRDAGGFKSIGEFLRTVAFNPNDTRLMNGVQARVAGMGSSVDPDGGFAVPPQFIPQLLDVEFENEIVRGSGDAEVYPMTQGDKLSIPGIDGADHSGPLLGGITVQHVAQGETGTVQKAKLRLVTFEPKKIMVIASATNELLADAPQYETQILRKFGSAVSFVLDEDFLSGDGAGKAVGATNANNPALIVVAKEGAQANGTIVYANLTKMLARLHPSLWRGARWVIHPSTLPQLLTLSLPVGTGGSHIPVLREDGSGTLRMLGLPALVSEKLQPIGSQGDILLVNFRGYGMAFRNGLQIMRSAHVGFTSDEIYFRLTLRADGQSLWNAPVTPRNGTDTLSWSIVLAERA